MEKQRKHRDNKAEYSQEYRLDELPYLAKTDENVHEVEAMVVRVFDYPGLLFL